jgi:hypothetical protein
LHLWCLTHRLVLVLVRLLGAPPTGGTHSSQTWSTFRWSSFRWSRFRWSRSKPQPIP